MLPFFSSAVLLSQTGKQMGGGAHLRLPNRQQLHVKWQLCRNTYTLHTRFCTFDADLYARCRCLVTKFLHRSPVGSLHIKSALLVGLVDAM